MKSRAWISGCVAIALSAPSAAFGYTGVEVKNGGSIAGAVTFTGKVPPPKKLTVNKDAEFCG